MISKTRNLFLDIIEALLSSLDDKNQDVRQSVIDSIVRISEKNSDVVIQTTVCFWEQHKKVNIWYSWG